MVEIMAAYRKISITFWADSFVQTLTPEGKYFYLYLMTNTRTTQCGIYEVTVNQMCFETGYNQETITKLLSQFEKSGKIKYSKSTNEIALKNWPKYNDSTSPKVLACVAKEVKLVKNKALIEYLYSIDTHTQETKPKEEEETEEETKPKFGATKVATIEDRSFSFMERLKPYVETYGKEMLREFFDYWVEMNPNGKKMRFEMQKVFDVQRRLTTWNKNKFSNGTGIDKREKGINSLKENFAKRVIERNQQL